MIDFLHTFSPDPIFFSAGPVHIYWYGFLVVLGIVVGTFICLRLAKYYGLEEDTILDLQFFLILAGLVGARIYDVFLEWPYYFGRPLDIFKIWQGGLAIHGAIIAGLLTSFLFARKHHLDFWLLAAVIAPGLAAAQAIGRWGNYFNQELFGQPTGRPWGIPIDLAKRPFDLVTTEYFHPAFLYESAGNLVIFLLLAAAHYLIIKKNRCGGLVFPGVATAYLIMYSALRYALEFIRIDSTPVVLGLRFPQLASLFTIAAAAAFLAFRFYWIRRS